MRSLIITSLLLGLTLPTAFGGLELSLSFAQQAPGTTLIGSTVEGIDQESSTVTVRTMQGNSWSLQVASADLMKDLHKGDRASLELDADGRVKKIVKTDEPVQGKTGQDNPQ
jgi:hypothetical protein